MTNPSPRRILAIDGGGVKGVLPAAFLTTLEQTTGKRVVDYFDLIAGTSTGGIIALGLGLGLRAADILQLYEENAASIFATRHRVPRFGRLATLSRNLFAPKYDHRPLAEALRQTFGQRLLGESETRLVIPAFERQRRTVRVFKTSHHERLRIDWKEPAVDVAMATAAAPTYFSSWRLADGVSLVDGGIWANNPAGLATVEGVGLLGWPRDNLFVLSLGCSEPVFDVPSKGGLLQVGRRVADLFLAGQSQASHGTAKILTGHTDQDPRVYRINPTTVWGRYALDGIDDIGDLKGMGATLARDHLEEVERVFLTGAREPFVPSWGGELRGLIRDG